MVSKNATMNHPTQEEWNQIRSISNKGLISILKKGSLPDRVLKCVVSEASHRNLNGALPTLINLLKNPSTSVPIKVEAISAATKIGRKRVLDVIIRIYKRTRSYDLKLASLSALGEIKDDKSFSVLVDALKREHGNPLYNAIDSLGKQRDRRALEALIDLNEKILSCEQIHAGEQFGEEAWITLIRIARAYRELNDPSVYNILLKGLKVDAPHERCYDYEKQALETLESLGYLKNSEASNVFVEILKNAKGPHLGDYIVPYLERIGDQKSIDFFWTESERSEEARTVLGRLKSERGLPICDCCGKLRELQPIEEITQQYLDICLDCWNKLEPLQENPDTRTVISCGWHKKS